MNQTLWFIEYVLVELLLLMLNLLSYNLLAVNTAFIGEVLKYYKNMQKKI
uniref:Uncharacterized protein n=1 Tax=Rhodnius prolixus TaxID=13249 RepID=T1HY48_RHOPR